MRLFKASASNVQPPLANVQPPVANVQPPLANVQPPLANVQQSSTFDNIGKGAYTGMVLYGKFQTIGTIIIGILGIMCLIYGIKLFFTNESNWKSETVIITKITSNNNISCDKDKLISTNSKNNTTTSLIYNCGIYFQFNNKEVFKQISNSSINYNVGENIIIYYDINNPNKDPEINKIFMSKYWWIFTLVGLILTIFGFLITYIILYNDDAAAIYGTGSFISSLRRN
jgi:hypothetical protein